MRSQRTTDRVSAMSRRWRWRWRRLRCRRHNACSLATVAFTTILLTLATNHHHVQGLQPYYECETDQDCHVRVGSDSFCRAAADDERDKDQNNSTINNLKNENNSKKFCSNPYERGCLAARLPGWEKVRVCNSDDGPDALERGICRLGDLPYPEVRIYGENWESAMFETWILQIILSEMLDVPTTIESGTPTAGYNLYDPRNQIEFGSTDGRIRYEALENSLLEGDCLRANRQHPDQEYQACADYMPENWDLQSTWVSDLYKDGFIPPPRGLGLIGQKAWFVTKFTTTNNPTFQSLAGLAGQDNRQKLAKTFLRPTKWKDYCEQVSADQCKTDNGVAKRAPRDENEYNRMYAGGEYTGYFRKTEESDCSKHPTNCTGHIIDLPCGWSSNVQQQTHHLDIALTSSGDEAGCRGYTYSQIVEIWRAANATKSNAMIYWWKPEALHHEFIGSESEMVRVVLPNPTRECIMKRVTREERCSGDPAVRIGDPRGACDERAIPLQSLMSTGFQNRMRDNPNSMAEQSPAYPVLSAFSINNLHIEEIFEYWHRTSTAREGLCQWVVDNMDYIEQFIPPSYPRKPVNVYREPLEYASIIVGCFALFLISITSSLVYRRRQRHIIRAAQVEFLGLLLIGALMVAIGSMVLEIHPSNGSCIASTWLISLGYTMDFVPLIVKIAAINRLMHAAQRMRRVHLKHSSLFGAVALIAAIQVLFLTIWMVVDPPQSKRQLDMTGTVTSDGSTVVEVRYYCSSNNMFWDYINVGWNGIFLFSAAVIAIQSRNVRQDFNESQTLSMLIYSHCIFLAIRLATLILQGTLGALFAEQRRSMIYVVDTIAGIVIYFLPKFVQKDGAVDRSGSTFGFRGAVDQHQTYGSGNPSSDPFTPPATHHLYPTNCTCCSKQEVRCNSSDSNNNLLACNGSNHSSNAAGKPGNAPQSTDEENINS